MKKRTRRKLTSVSTAAIQPAVPETAAPSVAAAPRRTNRPDERWTETIVSHGGWVPIARTFLRCYSTLEPKISPAEAMFIAHLMDFKRDKNPPYPSYKRLAQYMGVSDKMARLYAKRLEQKKYLQRQIRIGQPNLFDLTLLFNKLEYRIKQDQINKQRRPVGVAAAAAAGS